MQGIEIEPFAGAESVRRHEKENAREEGGINMKQDEEAGVWETLAAFTRKVAGKLLSGKLNFSTMQRPAALSNPVSHIQVIANEYCVLTRYIEAALTVRDPLERIKLITAGLIGNLSLNVYGSRGKGPVNPSLGETYQGRSASGCQVYAEQLSMSPHTTQVLIVGADNAFHFSAFVRFEVQLQRFLLSARGVSLSRYTLQLGDGTVYEFNWPDVFA